MFQYEGGYEFLLLFFGQCLIGQRNLKRACVKSKLSSSHYFSAGPPPEILIPTVISWPANLQTNNIDKLEQQHIFDLNRFVSKVAVNTKLNLSLVANEGMDGCLKQWRTCKSVLKAINKTLSAATYLVVVKSNNSSNFSDLYNSKSKHTKIYVFFFSFVVVVIIFFLFFV